jgi:hypothetical protein
MPRSENQIPTGYGMGGPGMIMMPGMMRMMMLMMTPMAMTFYRSKKCNRSMQECLRPWMLDKNGKVTIKEIQRFMSGQFVQPARTLTIMHCGPQISRQKQRPLMP